MPYPTSQAMLKHDITAIRRDDGDSNTDLVTTMMASSRFAKAQDLFHALDEEQQKEQLKEKKNSLFSVYSYSDAPDYPGPLAHSLQMVGVGDRSLPFVRNMLSSHDKNGNDPSGSTDQLVVPDCFHRCTIAVQLADEKHMPRLEPRHQTNSTAFARFLQRLREEQLVAFLGRDRYGRFGLLVPYPLQTNASSSSAIEAEDCYVGCYIGDVTEVKEYLSNRASSTSSSTQQEGGWNTENDSNSVENNVGAWNPSGGNNAADANGSSSSAPWESAANEDTTAPWESQTTAAAPWEQADNTPAPWEVSQDQSEPSPWETTTATTDPWSVGNKRSHEQISQQQDIEVRHFHADSTAAAADAFYSGLTRSLETRADSRLYHMRAFNGWVKATQIQELDPRVVVNGKVRGRAPLRVLDLACGKGGDLTKWTLHDRGMSTYVGIDVARGSLEDAAKRARELKKRNKLKQAVFTCADLGADVPGRKKSTKHKHMQKLLTWSLASEDSTNEPVTPIFKMIRGGGISEKEKFDVVSIQFAIHYMMSSRKRARRFFHTVSELLEIGGNLVCTTIDARVVISHLMNLGLDYHFDDGDTPASFSQAVVQAGGGACKLQFQPDVVKKILSANAEESSYENDVFGLEYTFTLVEGSDHASGVGDAVNLAEWLTPIPVLKSLGEEAGLRLEYAQNFHEFYDARKDASTHPAAHHALFNMKVLNRDGSISADEWSVSRMYAAIKFKKVGESQVAVDEDEEVPEVLSDEDDNKIQLDPAKAKKMLPMALMKAKKAAGDRWQSLSSDEKHQLTQNELAKLAAL